MSITLDSLRNEGGKFLKKLRCCIQSAIMTEYSYVLKILFVTTIVFKFAHKEQAKLSLISTAFVKKKIVGLQR